ncbi:MAG: Ig-like domain-containing protein, partial [Candidatus Poribacteria bacterium]|nr:Ig-like domain-containing protein [Candidatus Poribacteria bacterium]
DLSSGLGDQPGMEGESVAFSATVSNAGEARLFYNWDFGDGEQTGGIGKSEIEHTYNNEGDYTIKLVVSDSTSIEVEKETSVTIENIPPEVMTGSPYQVEEGGSITLDASKSVDLDKLTFAWDLGNGQTGTGESISYTPPNVGENLVTVTVSDGVDKVGQDVVVEVTNVAPVVDAGGPYTGQVGADIVIDGASAQDPSDPTGETFTYTWDLDADGTFEKTGQQVDFVPEESGKFEIALKVQDEDGGEAIAAAIVAVKAEDNVDPVAEDDAVEIEEDTPRAVIIDVLDNDDDENKKDVLKVADVGTPKFGTVKIIADGTKLSYLIDENADQDDGFTYSIDDGNGGLATATVSVTVIAINDLPTAEDDELATLEDEPLTISVTDLLANDTDVETEQGTGELTIKSVTAKSARGVDLALSADRTITYIPPENVFGKDSFTYTIVDDFDATAGATVRIVVEEVNDPPVPEKDTAKLPEDTKGFEIDVLFNDVDVDEDDLQVISVTQTVNGTIDIGPNGLPVYTPNENYFSLVGEPDFFTYVVSDGKGGDSVGEVEVFVDPVNDLPIAEGLTIQTKEDEPIEITLTAEDPDEDPLEFQIKPPLKGELTGDPPNLTYTPEPNFFGPDKFSFQVSDGTSQSLVAEVSIEVESVEDPPQFTHVDGAEIEVAKLNRSYNTGEQIGISFTVDNPDKSDITYGLEGLPEEAGGNVRPIRGGAVFTWLPKSAFAGEYTIGISAQGGGDSVGSPTLNLTIIQVNRAPSLSDIPSVVIDPDSDPVAKIPVAISDPDAEEEFKFTIIRLSKGAKGNPPEIGTPTYTEGEKGGTEATLELSWTPGDSDLGKVTEFILRIEDDDPQNPLSARASFSIGVGSVNTPPKLILDALAYNVREALPAATEADESSLLQIALQAEDAEEDQLQFEIEGAPEGAELELGESIGAVTWSPALDAGDGPEGFRIYTMVVRVVEVRDDEKEALSDERTVRIRVQNRNLIPLLSKIADQSVAEGDTLTVDFAAGDKDGDAVTLAADGLPPGAELIIVSEDVDGKVTGQINWTPTFNDATVEPISVTVTAQDPSGSAKEGQNSRTFRIEVTNTNQPPEIIADISTQTVVEGEALQFSVAFIDPDQAVDLAENLSLKLENEPPSAELIDSGDGTGTFRWQTDFESFIAEGYLPKIIAVDTSGESVTQEVQILVENVNRPPEFDLIEMPAQVVERESATVELVATDPDNPEELIQYEVRGNIPSEGVSIAGSKLLIEPALGDQGVHDLTLVAVDTEDAKTKVDVILNVVALNLKPEVEPIDPIYNSVVGDEITFTVVATDPNGDLLSIELAGTPDGAQFEVDQQQAKDASSVAGSPSIATGAFVWTPTPGQEGEIDLIVTVQETETKDQFKVVLDTRLVVIKREGPILRNLKIDGRRETATISVELEIKQSQNVTAPDNSVTVTLAVLEDESETELYTQSDIAEVTEPIIFAWDTSDFGLDAVTEYMIQATATDGVVENVLQIGPFLIDNAPPTITPAQTGLIEAGAGELVELSVEVRDNGEIEKVEFISEAGRFKAVGNASAAVSGGVYQSKIVIPEDVVDMLRSAGVASAEGTDLNLGNLLPYTIEAVDVAGNVARFPAEGDLKILILDKIAPEAVIDRTKLTIAQGEIVELDGGQSTDNSGRISGFAWDIDGQDGTNFEVTEYQQKQVSFVAEATTTVTLQVRDAAGNEAMAVAEIEVVDNTPPEPPFLQPIGENGLPVTVSKATITGIAEPEAAVTIFVEGLEDGASQQLETTANKEGLFTTAISGLTDGTYQILGTASDAAGNASPQSPSVTLVVDTTPPTIIVGFGAAGAQNRQQNRDPNFGILLEATQLNRMQSVALPETANPIPSIPVQVEDNGGLDTVEFILLEGSTPISLAGGATRQVNNAKTLSDTIVPLRDLINGVSYSVQVVAVDRAKLESIAKFQFKINLALADETPPQISFVLPDTDGMITAEARPELKFEMTDSGSGFDVSDQSLVKITLDGPGGAIALGSPLISSEDVKKAIVTAFPSVDLVEGKYQISVTVTDQNGNSQSGSRSFIVIGDPPAFEQAETEATFLAEPSTTISGSLDATKLPGGGNIEVFVNGNAVIRTGIDAQSGSFSVNVPLSEGENEVVLITENVMERKSPPSTKRIFILDTQPPLIASLEPASGTTLLKASEIRAIVRDSTVVATKISGIDSPTLQVYLNDQPLTGVEGSKYDETSGQLFYPILAELEEGSHRIRVEIADKQGNVAKAESEFTIEPGIIDETPPVITGLAPEKGALVNAEAIAGLTLRGAAYDVESGLEEVQIRLDGRVVGAQTEGEDETIGEIAYTPENLTEGEHLLTIYARDTSGNEQIVNAGFVVDAEIEVPTLSLSGFEGDDNAKAIIITENKISVNGLAEPESKVTVTINDKPSGTTIATLEGAFAFADLALNEGANTIVTTTTDKAANISPPSSPLEILVDSRPPRAGNPLPVPDSRTKSQVVSMSVEISDNPGGSGIDPESIFFVFDGNTDLYNFSYDGQQVSYTPATDSGELSELSEGEHFFRVMANDLAGNLVTFNSGKFAVDLTPPEFVELLPANNSKLSNAEVEVTAIVEADDLQKADGKLIKDGTEIPVDIDTDLFKGSVRMKGQAPLVSGNYTATITVIDVAGNSVEGTTIFTIDTTIVDEDPPSFVPQFPQPGTEVSTLNFNAIQFQTLDADQGVDFDQMSVEINGVVYDELFKPGSPHRVNRDTGEVTLFVRFQLELGGLEDPLELGGLEDPLELGGLEDPLELGGLEDPLELGGLEDPLELGALNRPLELGMGLNMVSITVPDQNGNFGLFDLPFEVSLSPPDSPDFLVQLAPPPPPDAVTLQMYTDFFINDINVEPTTVVAGEKFVIEFNT